MRVYFFFLNFRCKTEVFHGTNLSLMEAEFPHLTFIIPFMREHFVVRLFRDLETVSLNGCPSLGGGEALACDLRGAKPHVSVSN